MGGCCARDGGLCNSPDTNADARAMCLQMGYDDGKVAQETSVSNYCAESHYDGSKWTSDYVLSAGYGQEYFCCIGQCASNVAALQIVNSTNMKVQGVVAAGAIAGFAQ